jgi:hypothetical protein
MTIPNITALGATFTNLSDCSIVSDIGSYSYRPRGANLGAGSGVVGKAGHFNLDHTDSICTAVYSNITQLRGLSADKIEEQLVSVEVQVTQHSGDKSDKWLLHELERDFRNYYGQSDDSYVVRRIDGNNVLAVGAGGWDYRWISGSNLVVHIAYTDLMMEKPEPLEVVKAYLAKHPSTIPFSTLRELRDRERLRTWIRDEMERCLWLCDKWFMQLQLKKAEEKDVYREAVESMTVFLNYREKYFGIKAEDETILLDTYRMQNNGTGIKAKLKEYKNWWGLNKDKAISL